MSPCVLLLTLCPEEYIGAWTKLFRDKTLLIVSKYSKINVFFFLPCLDGSGMIGGHPVPHVSAPVTHQVAPPAV